MAHLLMLHGHPVGYLPPTYASEILTSGGDTVQDEINKKEHIYFGGAAAWTKEATGTYYHDITVSHYGIYLLSLNFRPNSGASNLKIIAGSTTNEAIGGLPQAQQYQFLSTSVILDFTESKTLRLYCIVENDVANTIRCNLDLLTPS